MSKGKRLAIFGKSGSGKSTLMDSIIRYERRVILFDYLTTRRDFARRYGFVECTNLEQVREHVARGYGTGFKIWFRPPSTDQVRALHELSAWLFHLSGKRTNEGKECPLITLAVDEMSECFPTNTPKDMNGFTRVCKAGRHFNINVVGASQRPSHTHTDFRGNLDGIAFFAMSAPTDIEATRKMGGTEISEFVSTAENFDYVGLNNGELHYGRTEKL